MGAAIARALLQSAPPARNATSPPPCPRCWTPRASRARARRSRGRSRARTRPTPMPCWRCRRWRCWRRRGPSAPRTRPRTCRRATPSGQLAPAARGVSAAPPPDGGQLDRCGPHRRRPGPGETRWSAPSSSSIFGLGLRAQQRHVRRWKPGGRRWPSPRKTSCTRPASETGRAARRPPRLTAAPLTARAESASPPACGGSAACTDYPTRSRSPSALRGESGREEVMRVIRWGRLGLLVSVAVVAGAGIGCGEPGSTPTTSTTTSTTSELLPRRKLNPFEGKVTQSNTVADQNGFAVKTDSISERLGAGVHWKLRMGRREPHRDGSGVQR